MSRREKRMAGRLAYTMRRKIKKEENRQKHQDFMQTKLTRNGWTISEEGDMATKGDVTCSLDEACQMINKERRAEQDCESIANYLKDNGWTQSGPNGEVWSINHPKGDKIYATIFQARKLQWKFEAQTRAAYEATIV